MTESRGSPLTSADPFTSLLPAGVPIDLDNCAREPIHVPGSIQPRGVLLALREEDQVVTQVSANLGELTGQAAADAIGHTLAEVLGPELAATVRRATVSFGDLTERNPFDVILNVDGEAVSFDAMFHRVQDGTLLVELEGAEGPRPFSFPNTYLAVRGAVADLNQAASLTDLYDITARAVRDLTGFDRVMVYRYDHEFNGEVVAENKRSDLETLLGLHYPASDIPAQARALYEKNWIRLISDVDYQPSPLVPADAAALDLTLSTLRSVSPIHIEYLHNMGVRASMSISLLRHGTLWGLIACHHYAGPHTPPYGVRAAAEFLGSTLSLRLVDRAEEIELRVALDAQGVLGKLNAATLDEGRSVAGILVAAPSVLDLIPADGVAVCAEGHIETLGVVPDTETVAAIARWARSLGDDVVITDSLSLSAPELGVAATVASGVLALVLPQDQYVLWFRSEAHHAIDWAGDPRAKVVEIPAPEGVRIGPRASFARWREVVRGRSMPWTTEQRQLASDLRTHTVEALYARSQRGLHLAETLQRSLLPSSLPSMPNWVVTAHYETAEGGQVGGDWYDAMAIGDHALAVVLGDVAGHGITAAGTMAQLRNALRAYLLDTASPGEALAKVNQFTNLLLPAAFATAVVAHIDTDTGDVAAASAGHLTPYIVTPGFAPSPAPLRTSPPLGVLEASYHVSQFRVPPGSGLIFFSDGLVERRTEHLSVGLRRLASALRQLDPQADATAIFAATAETGAYDDATVLAVHHLARPA